MPRRHDIDRLHSEIQELFAELWQVPRLSGLHRGFRPHVDVFRTADPPELTILVDLAGVDCECIELVVIDRSLVIAGQRRRSQPEGPCSYQQMEIEYGTFQRTIQLSEDVDTEGAQASYEQGLLKIVLPIAPRPPATVKVSIEVRMRP